MSNQNSIQDDISYMRRLAETGRRGPILGGAFLAAAGVVFGITCIIDWCARSGLLPIGGWGLHYLWLGAFALFAVVWVVLFLRLRSGPGKSASTSNTAFSASWSAIAIGVFVALAAVEIVANVLKAPIILNAFVPMIFVFYGIAWFSSALTAKQPWMYWPAAGSFLLCLVMAALAQNPLQTAVMGLGLILLLTLPGLKMMASEAKS